MLRQVMETYTSARNAGGRVVLLNPRARAMQVLLIAKLVTVFDVYDDEAAAVEALAEYVVDTHESPAVESPGVSTW